MDTNVDRRRLLSPTTRRIVRAYGLLIVAAIAFLMLAMCVHEAPKTVPAESVGLLGLV
jgi:hypothetical protein